MFKVLMVLSSLGIFVINPIQALLWLVLVFILAGFFLIEMGAEFLAILLVLVYVGAIAVLFLFVIMLLNIRKVELNNYYINYWPVFGLITLFFCFELYFIFSLKTPTAGVNLLGNIYDLNSSNNIVNFFWISNLYYTTNIKVIGILLFEIYYHYFFLLSLILLVALLGTLVLLVVDNTGDKHLNKRFQSTQSYFKVLKNKRASNKLDIKNGLYLEKKKKWKY